MPSSRCSCANQPPSSTPRTAASGAGAASMTVTCAPSRARGGGDFLADEAGADHDDARAA